MVDRWAWLPRLGHSSRTKRETRGRRAKLNIWDVAELGRGGIVVQSITFGMMPSWGRAGKGLEYSFVDCLAFAVGGLDVRGLAVTNVARIVSVGDSICRILRGLEAPGSSICRILRVWEVRGGSICRILRCFWQCSLRSGQKGRIYRIL